MNRFRKENIGPLNLDIPPFGEMTLDDNPILHYMDVIDLPEGKKRDACSEHIEAGRAVDLLEEFFISGCHFPSPDQDQMVRTALICLGPSLLRECRLRLVQADAAGNILTEGST